VPPDSGFELLEVDELGLLVLLLLLHAATAATDMTATAARPVLVRI
jgi:hypothetical protein